MGEQLNPERIIQTGMAFWSSKTLLSAIEMGLFNRTGSGSSIARNADGLFRAAPTLSTGFSRYAGRTRFSETHRRLLFQYP